ncbi:MAG TPA: hypothetical protein VHK89_02665 [Actinomycetota bacterium]|nr:hypothetical protein [Actinomycetota bacterium]
MAGLQAIALAALLLAFGRLVAGAVAGRRDLDEPALWGLGVAGLTLYSLALMAAHMASGGRVLSNAWLTRGSTGAVFVALALVALRDRARAGRPPDRRALAAAAAVAAAAALVWGLPVGRVLPLPPGGDVILHAGWSSQLINGEPTPSAFITGDVPNFYPWLFHALLALIARLTPGGRALHAMGPLQLVLSSGVALCLFALGRALTRSTLGGAAAALLCALTGGLGFVMLRGVDIVLEPRTDALRYLGDLLYKRSYNASFYNLAPPFPRDLAFALLLSFLLLLVIGLRAGRTRVLVGAGIALGMAGLTGAEAFFAGAGVAAAAALWRPAGGRARALAALMAPALGLYALWAVPQLAAYLSLGGYRNLTAVGPVTLPPIGVLGGWGITTPLAALGLLWVRRALSDPGSRVLVAATSVTLGLVIASTVVPELFGEAFLSLGRAHRYWPLLHLCVALFAALGATALVARAARAGRGWAVAAGLALVALAVPSPVVASLALGPDGPGKGVLLGAVRGEPRSLLNLISPEPGGDCVVAAPVGIDAPIFTYTGYRMVMYTWGTEDPGNRARIRWQDIYERIVPEQERLRDNRLLVRGTASPALWRTTARRYGVDIVVVPEADAARPVFASVARAEAGDAPFVVVRLRRCGP